MKKEADEIQSYTITKNSLNKIKGKGTHLLTGERPGHQSKHSLLGEAIISFSPPFLGSTSLREC
jgi:hypothetical protein